MDSLTIARANVVYRVPDSRPELEHRLDRVREQLLTRALEDAFVHEGVLEHEALCIRALRVSVQLPARLGEVALLEHWAQAMTQAIRERIQAGDPRQVLRYGSPLAALIDMGRSLAHGDRRRAWAWQALGLCRIDELDSPSASARVFARALLARPQQIVAALVGLSGTPEATARWLASLPAESWLGLADAALRVHGLDPVTRERLCVAISAAASEMSQAPRWSTTKIDRALVGSPILGLVAVLTRAGSNHPSTTRSIVGVLELLALLDVAPLEARRLLTARVGDAALRSSVGMNGTGHSGTRIADLRELPIQPVVRRQAIHPEAWSDQPLDARIHGSSEWAGLLLTLALVRREQLWTSIDALAEAHHLAPRALLHGFARALVPEGVAPDDPAILAFIGLPPGTDPPAIALDVRGLLAEPRAKLLEALERCLPISEHRPNHGEALLAWLVHRFGEVRGEPGWLEVRLGRREVDADIRRAGLDLDPDWLPELGVVVKFV